MQTAVLMAIAIAATMVLSVVPVVYATADNSNNDFGEDASENLATDKSEDGRSEMGEHSSEPAGEKRSGIGNVFNQGDPNEDEDDSIGEDPNPGEPDSKHPSDTGNRLCTADPSNDACVDEDD
jgi:hypothetical protein